MQQPSRIAAKDVFEKALSYHELAGSPKERIAALKQKTAQAYLNAAAKSSDRSTREYLLTAAVDEAPESAAAAEATRRLADLAKDENRGLRMSKQFLLDNPAAWRDNRPQPHLSPQAMRHSHCGECS